jgi:hypothetical protein
MAHIVVGVGQDADYLGIEGEVEDVGCPSELDVLTR